MLKLVTRWKKWLWEFVELSFLFLLALILLHLLLGSAGGPYLAAVADNVTKFATAGSGGMLGIVLVLGIVYFVLKRRGWSHTADE
jgi:hypothetical protein